MIFSRNLPEKNQWNHGFGEMSSSKMSQNYRHKIRCTYNRKIPTWVLLKGILTTWMGSFPEGILRNFGKFSIFNQK